MDCWTLDFWTLDYKRWTAKRRNMIADYFTHCV